MRMHFYDLFAVTPDRMISPRVPVHINGVTMGPGVAFGGGVSFGGVDLAGIAGRDLEVVVENGVHVIKGHYT